MYYEILKIIYVHHDFFSRNLMFRKENLDFILNQLLQILKKFLNFERIDNIIEVNRKFGIFYTLSVHYNFLDLILKNFVIIVARQRRMYIMRTKEHYYIFLYTEKHG